MKNHSITIISILCLLLSQCSFFEPPIEESKITVSWISYDEFDENNMKQIEELVKNIPGKELSYEEKKVVAKCIAEIKIVDEEEIVPSHISAGTIADWLITKPGCYYFHGENGIILSVRDNAPYFNQLPLSMRRRFFWENAVRKLRPSMEAAKKLRCVK